MARDDVRDGDCGCGPCGCGDTDERSEGDVSRRSFLRSASAGALTAASLGAGRAFTAEEVNEYLRVIPADKGFTKEQVEALYRRGGPSVVQQPDALRHVGMPVGGLFAGTVYLGGDGRLWLWDIFNRDQEGIDPRRVDWEGRAIRTRDGANYVSPAPPKSPFRQGFAIRVGDRVRSLDLDGFSEDCDVRFEGRYPIGRVRYDDFDRAFPVSVTLEAFSPFVPLDVDDSSLPAVVMDYTIENRTDEAVEIELIGHLENPVCRETRSRVTGRLRNRVVREGKLTAIECLAEPRREPAAPVRPDIVFDRFETPTYDGWTAEGTAFGTGPVAMEDIPDYQGDVGGEGKRVVNSHASAPGVGVGPKDAKTGRLTSREFKIERRFISLLVGGGAHRGKTCVDLLVGGEVVASLTGRSDNRMQRTAFDVRKYEGKTARLRIVDEVSGGWGNIGVDDIVFSDQPPQSGDLEDQRDFGTMTLTMLGRDDADRATASRSEGTASTAATGDLAAELIGELGRKVVLAPKATATVTFAVTWHFRNFRGRGVGGRSVGHSYAARFDSALAVSRHIAEHFERLAGDTREWVETWYDDSTLPHWLLDRAMANTSTLATTTCYRFADGRFWAWEGIGCCHGTCTHVWHYAQAPGRLFPEIERDTRERVDFGLGLHEDGGVGHRAGLTGSAHPADDGQCGRILGVYREHQMSTDDAFLRRLWPRVKKAIEYLFRKDGDADGMIEGSQPNTLDAAWFGKISFLASLYLAALRAGEAMAKDVGDEAFAKRCAAIAERGAQSILETYNGEYFTQIEDPAHRNAIGVGPGCYIDQVFGQTWAHWVGLGRLFDRDKQLSALRALWKYNFVPDVGKFRREFRQGRWYAVQGDAGLLMCTWPKGGQNPGFKKHWQYGYFNECMSGFEWQAAAHMIWEGLDQEDLLDKGLALTYSIDRRYDAAHRNPYNEVECSDHYARAMASYGVFQAVCGFEYHGPKGHVAFAPRFHPDEFRAAFVTAEGWGTFSQNRDFEVGTYDLDVRWGRLAIRSLAVRVPPGTRVRRVTATLGERELGCAFELDGQALSVRLDERVTVERGARLRLRYAIE